MTSTRPTHVVVVTGLSGAGKSTALAALEDLGFHAIENIPPGVIGPAIEACEQAGVALLALGFGGSVGAFLDAASGALAAVAASSRKVTVVFLDASDEAVQRRFNETRRPHPLTREHQRTGEGAKPASVLEAVQHERARLASLRAMADVVIDTSELRVHDLRKRIISTLRPDQDAGRMSTRVVSFGFKYGHPSDADLVFDVRFLDNPHFVPELRPLTGLDERVRRYVLEAPGASEFLELIASLLAFLVPRYEEEGKSYLTIAIGCTGGQHRSVAVAEAVAERLRAAAPGGRGGVSVVHRDAKTNAAVVS